MLEGVSVTLHRPDGVELRKLLSVRKLSPCVSDHTRHRTNQLTPSLLLNEQHGFEDRRGELPAIISARAWGVSRLGFSRNDAHGRSRGLIIPLASPLA
jgi:hypothetical protein